MKINKITSGFVVQTFDTELQKWSGQEFVAGDQADYEDAGTGTPVDPAQIWPTSPEPHLPFLMQQPD
jgi:hypothetical protein